MQPYLLTPRDDIPISEVIKVLNLLVAGNRAVLYFEPLTAEPATKGEGTLAYADGVNWNPGEGVGLYQYRGGSWVPMWTITPPLGAVVYGERVIASGSGTSQVFGERVT